MDEPQLKAVCDQYLRQQSAHTADTNAELAENIALEISAI